MIALWLGRNRFLVLYNRRFGQQSVHMCLVRAKEKEWSVEFEGTMWDAQVSLELTEDTSSNEEVRKLKFGYPMPLRLEDETALAVHSCEENGICGVRWTCLHLML